VTAQDYEVSDINCSFGDVSVETNSRINQIMSAVLKKPEKFQGSPIFADDRWFSVAICKHKQGYKSHDLL
jgi:hypothetical protein